MARKYQLAQEHNNYGDVEDIDPQPFGIPVRAVAYAYSGENTQIEQGGRYIELRWSTITVNQLESLLLQFGFYPSTIQTVEVTVVARHTPKLFDKYNGLVHRPIPDQDYKLISGGLVRDLVIIISEIDEI